MRQSFNAKMIRRIAKLEVDRSSESLLMGKVSNGAGFFECFAHWLLHQYCRLLRQQRKNIEQLRSGHGNVEDCITRSKRHYGGNRAKTMCNVVLSSQRCCLTGIDICDCDDRKPRLLISRKVSGMNDPSRSQND